MCLDSLVEYIKKDEGSPRDADGVTSSVRVRCGVVMGLGVVDRRCGHGWGCERQIG